MFRVQATTQHWGSNLQRQCLPECSLGQRKQRSILPPQTRSIPASCLTCSPAGGPFAEAQWHPEKLPVLHQRSITESKLPHPSTNTGDPLA